MLQFMVSIAVIAVCAMALFAMYEAVGTLRSLRRSSDELRERLLPMLEKADVTLDAVNAELLRIDGVVTQFEEVTGRVTSTTTAVHDAVNAPLETLVNLGGSLRRAVSVWRRGRGA